VRQTSMWMGIAAIACGVAFAQKPDTEGPVLLGRDGAVGAVQVVGPGPLAGVISDGIGVAQFGLIGPVVKGAPYSAEAVTESTQTLGDGTHINRQEAHTIYRDGEGRVRRESGEEAWISDPVANVSYVLDTKQQTARKMPLSRSVAFNKMRLDAQQSTMQTPQVKAGGSPAGSNTRFSAGAGMLTMWKTDQPEKAESLGKQEMEGVEVDGTRTTTEIPVGQIGNDRPLQIVHERWESAELHVTILEKHSDPMVGNTVERLTSVRRGEPDPALFEVPAGYQVESVK
jgi:hypothetical protein